MITAYRIADARHPIYDATGAMLHGGRWNSVGRPVIYAAETFAGAMLEVLVHANLSHPPRNQQAVRILVPEAITIETVCAQDLAGWDAEDRIVSRAYGDAWLLSRRTAVLRVPGVITQGRESNIVLNTQHPQFALITAEAPEPIHWDARLFHSP